MIFRLLADGLVVFHVAFVLFVVLGGLVVLRRPRAVWFHLPAALWGAAIEIGGWICPLTPLENHLRHLGGEAGYRGGFIDHYLIPILYPDGLTRTTQLLLAAFVIGFNAVVYTLHFRRRNRLRSGATRTPRP